MYDTFGSSTKFLIVLRNPADRAYSHYKMNKFRGFEHLSFKEAIEKEAERIGKNQKYKFRYSYIDRGYYYKQIQRYLQYFPKENFLILNFERDIVKNIETGIKKICNYLDVDYVSLDYNIHANESKKAIVPQINKVLVDPSHFISNAIKFIPSKLKMSIKDFILNLNQSNYQNGKKVIKKEKSELINRFYFDDIKS